MSVKITLVADVPDDALEPFLMLMRAFDRAHHGCHLKCSALGESENMRVGEIIRMLERVGIPLVFAERN